MGTLLPLPCVHFLFDFSAYMFSLSISKEYGIMLLNLLYFENEWLRLEWRQVEVDWFHWGTYFLKGFFE